MIDQLELKLEELETVEGAETSAETDRGVSTPVAAKRRPKRLPLPEHLPRRDIVHAAPGGDDCVAGGGTMAKLGESVTEVLDYVPGRFYVLRHVRPKLACQRCDAIVQAPAPACRSRAARPEQRCSPTCSALGTPTICPLYRQA